MAKEFDIYLNRRVVECDLMVLSLPFRDGLTADNRMILDTCVDAYLLYKIVAAQTKSSIEQHIDEMLKTCYEMLHADAAIHADADFQTHYTMYPDDFALDIRTRDVPALANLFTQAENALQLGIDLINAGIGQSVGEGSTFVELDVKLTDAIKNSLLKTIDSLSVKADVGHTSIENFVETQSPVELTAEIDNLCYRITDAASAAVELSALVLGTEIHFPFGHAYTNMAFGSSVSGAYLTRRETVHGAINILATLIEKMTQYTTPSSHAMEMTMHAQPVIKRHRLLSEMDADTLDTLSESTLEDLYYVEIKD